MRRILAGILLIMASLWFSCSTTLAHAYLVQAQPPVGAVLVSTPDRIRLVFSEAIEPKFSSFSLYDAQGTKLMELSFKLEEENQQLLLSFQPLDPGLYTLAWKVLSAVDGHVTKGTYPFSIGTASGALLATSAETNVAPLSPFRIIIRWIVLLSVMVLVGGLFSSFLILRASPAVDLAGHVKSVFWTSWVIFIVASVTDFFLQALTVSEASFSQLFTQGLLAQLLFQTRYGLIWLGRSALTLILAFMAFRRKSSDGLIATVGALVLLCISLSSHSAALESWVYLAVFADGMHLVAAAILVGGLLQLSFLFSALRRLPSEERTQVLSGLAPRFYSWAFISAAVLLLTGFHLTYRHIPNLEAALWTTDYGRAYIVKHLLLLPLLALAAVNLLGMTRWAKEGLERLVRLEAVMATAIVLFAGLLTQLPTANQAASGTQAQARNSAPVALVLPTDGYAIALTLSSGQVGQNIYDVLVVGPDGKSVTDAQRIWLTFKYLDDDLGELSSTAVPRGDGHYQTQGSYVSLPGHWQIDVAVRFAQRADDLHAAFSLDMKGTAAAKPHTEAPPADLAMIAAGKALYQAYCMSCHGESGQGDSPLAEGLSIPPANLLAHLEHHDDESLRGIIENGKPPVMPAFGATLREEQIRQLISYLRTLAKQK